MQRLLGMAFALATFTACHSDFHNGDEPADVMSRWSSVYWEECPSWLISARTGREYCASPGFTATVKPPVSAYELAAAAAAAAPPAEQKTDKDSLMAEGEKVYGRICVACHQADGKGMANLAPPLAGSGSFYGDAQNMSKILVHGLNAVPIEVQGVKWQGVMPAQGGALSDYEIAAVATYVRHSWGNNDGVVLPTDVAAVR